jgi:PAS domain S-box-containing protein
MNQSTWQSEEQFRSLFQFSPIGTVLINSEGIFVQGNSAFYELFGYNQEELNSLSFSDFLYPNEQTETRNLFQELLTKKRTHFNSITCCSCNTGEKLWCNLSIHLVQSADDSPQYAIAMMQKLSESASSLLNLQNLNANLTQKITGQSQELIQKQNLLEITKTEYKKVKKALKLKNELTKTLLELYPNTTLKQGGFAIVTDANTLEAMESELQQTKEQLRAVLDAMPGFVCWMSTDGKYLGVNQHMADTFNIPSDAFVGQELGFLHNSPEFVQFLAQFLADSTATGHQVVEAQVNHCTRHYLIAAQKYFQGSLAVSVGIDITDRKQAEAQIQASLREKEVLLQEIHHRVKNNLQVISSLLDLQSQQIENSLMLEVFRESQNRVKSMALVHEKLYQSKNFAKINFAEYTESLLNYLLKAYELHSGNVTLEIDIDEVTFNIDTAIPCGLIINELVSNALKYAFPDNQVGIIRIQLQVEGERDFTLTIQDNGVGLPLDWDIKNVKSLGLQLVKVLTKQLKGTLEIDRSLGSQFRVKFSELHRSED